MPSTPTIPGVTSAYNTSKMIEDLMKVESIPLVKLENKVEEIETTKKSWMRINSQLSKLGDSSKGLFGFENPFNEKIATSSNENIVTATASRDSDIQDFEIKVNKIATADKFRTSTLPSDYEISKGKYSFKIGDKEVAFYYKGGTLKDFSRVLNKKGGDNLHSSVVRVTPKENVMIIESLLSGQDNRMDFLNDARSLAIKTSMIIDTPSGGKTSRLLDQTELKPLAGKKVDLSSIENREKGAILIRYHFTQPGEKTGMPNASTVEGADAVIPISGSVTVEDITIFQAPSDADLNQQNKNILDLDPIEKAASSSELIVLNKESGAEPLENILPSSEGKLISISLSENMDLQSIQFNNIYQDRTMVIESVALDSDSSRSYTPKDPMSLAGDALLELDGLEVHRKSNIVDDLLYGITLNLNKSSEEIVNLSIESDMEAIKNSIIEYVYNYNKTIETTLVLTTSNEEVIEELAYLEESDKESLREQLGTMKGDSTLVRLKDRLQTITTSAYKEGKNSSIVLLSQLGISSNATGSGGFNPTKLRGYLEFDEEKLENAILESITDVKDFFGVDTNEDLIIDSGLAYEVSNYLKSYTGTGGLIYNKMNLFDSQIERAEKDIRTMEERLERKEQDYKVKFGRMEGMIEELQKNSQSLDGLNRD